jgi:hypothetical protein
LGGELEREEADAWPDVLGCGAYPLLVVSGRVIDAWRTEQIGVFPAARMRLSRPFPAGLGTAEPPDYWWIDGGKMFGARMDFDASGFVGTRFCSACHRRTDDISKTYDRQHSETWPYKFIDGTWTGAELFTTDLSPAAFFCTKRVVECAARNKHMNFRFTRVESGIATSSPGLDYLAGKVE